mmetsp:Transcript_21713/g.51904  ORF Transcript_21713/g.51904 Transcript_21713/m.51904 type:complete len:80 (+) Transcript_21713:883-1122(+)
MVVQCLYLLPTIWGKMRVFESFKQVVSPVLLTGDVVKTLSVSYEMNDLGVFNRIQMQACEKDFICVCTVGATPKAVIGL